VELQAVVFVTAGVLLQMAPLAWQELRQRFRVVCWFSVPPFPGDVLGEDAIHDGMRGERVHGCMAKARSS
jgi:hypothetical protein